ncbi:MAG TPA: isoprenylcysteine carboxylmethyltransferase family protein [Acidobacteriaceae bacterium]|nr:isoprenylcysteine carboxylmethyltransferase family protein [Acidobacteriaceae bacterium]
MSGRTGWQKIARRIRVPMGFVFAAVFLWLARPNVRTLALSVLLVVPGVWLRGYASGYVKKNAELATTGPYAYTRNPLYLGSMLIAFGFAVAAGGSWLSFGIITGLLAGLFAAIYIPTILSEEAYLRAHFTGFEAYARVVPRLLPRLSPALFAREAEDTYPAGFSSQLYRKHREYNCAFGAAAIYAALVLSMFVRRG